MAIGNKTKDINDDLRMTNYEVSLFCSLSPFGGSGAKKSYLLPLI